MRRHKLVVSTALLLGALAGLATEVSTLVGQSKTFSDEFKTVFDVVAYVRWPSPAPYPAVSARTPPPQHTSPPHVQVLLLLGGLYTMCIGTLFTWKRPWIGYSLAVMLTIAMGAAMRVITTRWEALGSYIILVFGSMLCAAAWAVRAVCTRGRVRTLVRASRWGCGAALRCTRTETEAEGRHHRMLHHRHIPHQPSCFGATRTTPGCRRRVPSRTVSPRVSTLTLAPNLWCAERWHRRVRQRRRHVPRHCSAAPRVRLLHQRAWV